MRFMRRAVERRHEWSDPSGQALQMTNLAQLADALEDIEEAKSHLGLAFLYLKLQLIPLIGRPS